MTTHLVIADQDTIDKITDHAEKAGSLAYMFDGDSQPIEGDWLHVETHDTWLFRTPEDSPDPMDGKAHRAYGLRVDFLYVLHPGYMAFLWTVTDNPDPARSILPLIAACDLLGVDEL